MADQRFWDALSCIDRDLQRATIYSDPYKRPVEDDSYEAGYLNGLAYAFAQFRTIAEREGLGWTPGYVSTDAEPMLHARVGAFSRTDCRCEIGRDHRIDGTPCDIRGRRLPDDAGSGS